MKLTKFVDQLPIPAIAQPQGFQNGVPFYEIVMKPTQQQLHRDLPPTPLWGYDGKYPGPTLEAQTGIPIKVRWVNQLPVNEHLLPVDQTVHGAQPPNPLVRTVVHLHGAAVPATSDGYPEAWFTNDFEVTGPWFSTEVYDYPNCQSAASLWYHDHSLGTTRLNLYSGLLGAYLLRDTLEANLNLPQGDYEIPLLIHDRSLNEDGTLFYPGQIQPTFFGDLMVVNGKAWPFLEVEPRKYRFRLYNTSNSRFLSLQLSSGQNFVQIGTDGGLLERPLEVKQITLGPGERADTIVNFANCAGLTIILTNHAPTPFPNGTPPDAETTGQVMQFRVCKALSQPDTSVVPDQLRHLLRLEAKDASVSRSLTLNTATDELGRTMLLLANKRWSAPVSETPELGTIEIWNLINTTPGTHPIHLHLVQFQLLERQLFDVAYFQATGQLIYTGEPIKPQPDELGWKDTIRVNPGEITRIIVPFDCFSGRYVWHCHMLEHEDHEMMRPYEVVEPAQDEEPEE